MKINNINIKKYILFTFICFLSVIGISNAEQQLKNGMSTSFPSPAGEQCELLDKNIPGLSFTEAEGGVGYNLIYYLENDAEAVENDNRKITIQCGTKEFNYTLISKATSQSGESGGNTGGEVTFYFGENVTCNYQSPLQANTNGQKGVHGPIGTSSVPTGCKYTGQFISSPEVANPATLEFAGWLPAAMGGTMEIVGFGPNACEGATTNPSVSSVATYSPCFKNNTAIVQAQTSIPNTTITGSGWVSANTAGTGGFIHVGSSQSDTAPLPSLTFSGEAKEYVWRNGSEEKKPGDAVPHDGAIWVAVEKGSGAALEDIHKSVYLNKITPVYVTGISSCSSSDSHVSASFINGECQVRGLSVTANGEYADILVNVADKTIIYKFTVVNPIGNTQNGGEDFEIDTSSSVIIGKNDQTTSEDDILTTTCDNFLVSKIGDSSAFASTDGGNMSSSLFDVEPNGCDIGTKDYIALCLDPGRIGPMGSDKINYKRSTRINPESDFGKLVNYIGQTISATSLRTVEDTDRIAANAAIRVVAIQTGLTSALDQSDVVYAAHYNWHKTIANALNANPSDIAGAVGSVTWLNEAAKTKMIEILTNYKSVETSKNGKLTKEIEKVEPAPNGNGYTLTYTGKLKIPTNEDVATPENCPGANGVSCTVTSWEYDEAASNETGLKVYNYTVVVTVGDALTVKPPKTKEEQKALSIKLKYKGSNLVDDIFLLEPSDRYSYQRMIVFNVSEQDAEVYIYFPITNKGLCEQIPALQSSNCQSADNCSNFNMELYKDSGCCEFNAVEGNYVHDTICNGKCTKSTLVDVCTFDPDQEGTTTTYQITEGIKGSEDSIDECIVNTTDLLTPDNVPDFERVDDNGNSRVVDRYESNYYCRVTCKEDWDIQLDNFGSLVGENAVAAGTYFTDGSSVYLKSTMTCYTNYIDYDKYNDEEVNLSEEIIKYYNIYSLNSHVYTDVHRQQELDSSNKLDKKTTATKDQVAAQEDDQEDDEEAEEDDQENASCIQYMTCAETYGSDYSSYNSTNGQCYKPKTCTAEEKEAGETDCNDYKEAPKCAYSASSFDYTLETTGEVEELAGDEQADLLYKGEEKTPEKNDHLGNGIGTTYNTEVIPKEKNKAKDVYKTTAKIDCTVTPAEAGNGTTGDYKCDLTVNTYDMDSDTLKDYVYEDISVSCPNSSNAYVKQDAKDSDGNTITLNSKFKNGSNIQICNPDVTADPDKYNKFEEGNGADDHDLKSPFQIMAEKIKEITKENLTSAKSHINAAHSAIYAKDRAMYECQHFQLFNNTDDSSCQVKAVSKFSSDKAKDETSLGENREYVLLDASYDPKVSYTYDEDGFMTILKDDNILVKYTQKNDKIVEENGVNIKEPGTEPSELGDSGAETLTSNVNGKVNSSDAGEDGKGWQNVVKTTYQNSCGIKIHYKVPEESSTDPGSDEYDLAHDFVDTEYCNSERIMTEEEGKKYQCPGERKKKIDSTTKEITFCTVYGKDTGTGGKSYWVAGKEGSGYTAFTSGIESSPEWNGGHCYKVTLRFYKAHYIKQEMENSSFYKTKGSWYLRASDVKEHGDDLDGALDNAGDRSATLDYSHDDEEYDYWSLLGTGYNIFPVSITTPRNLYQYTYYFGDMGTYDDGELGRLMGNQNSVIQMNHRLCFYEVYEELCLCCGDEIDTHYEDEEYKKTEEFINSDAPQFGYNYTLSDIGEIKLNDKGIITFATSSVSLGDLGSDSNRELGTNWSDDSPVYFNGHNLSTDKGAKLKDIIEHQGETVYEAKGEDGEASNSNSMVEYRFTLTPETMQKIREYNRGHGYEIDYKNLKVYGKYSIANINDDGSINSSAGSLNFVSSNKDVLKNQVSTFQHLGSRFLEETLGGMDGVVKEGTLSTRTNDAKNVCYVTSEDLKDAEQGANKIKELIKGNGAECRWIDYIETNSNNVIHEYRATGNGTPVILRLSFK